MSKEKRYVIVKSTICLTINIFENMYSVARPRQTKNAFFLIVETLILSTKSC
jgi:hypothetical protein